MKKVTLTGIVGYTLLGFSVWIMLRGVWRIFVWALQTLEPYADPIAFGPWECLGTVVLSAAVGWAIYKARTDGVTL